MTISDWRKSAALYLIKLRKIQRLNINYFSFF